MRTSLAWKNLTNDWRRLMIASMGITFAAVLMFMQNGFRNALLDSPVQIVHALQGDLFAVSRQKYSLVSESRFPKHLLERAATDPNVIAVTPIYTELTRAQVRVVGKPARPIRVVAAPLQTGVYRDQEIDEQLDLLAKPGVGLFDRQSRSNFGFQLGDRQRLSQQEIELLGKRLTGVGTFSVGTDFANEGTIVLSADNFGRYFSFRNRGQPLQIVDLGQIHIKPSADPEMVASRLTSLAPRDWEVVPRSRIIHREVAFWSRETPIGMIFTVGAMMGFAVGVIICYQILFTSIHDSMSEFATLKAMGYSNGYFIRLVAMQSVYLAIIGFIPALLVTMGLFSLVHHLVGLPMLLTPMRIVLVLGLTIAMCLFSGLLAVRKLLNTDPASLF
ncbi:MAG: ABC transporter permease DevC [Planctomycetota bacterium]